MAEPISYPGLMISLFLPWILGYVWIRWLVLKSGRWNWFVLAGQGYFLGIFATTLIMRLSDWAGLGLHFWGLAAALALLAISGIIIQLTHPAADRQPAIAISLPGWQKVVVALLLALLAWRYLTILQEMLLRPLYAWDAWMNWAPKAIVWFHLEELVDYVSPDEWLRQDWGAANYTLGNLNSSLYPPTVPLIQLWSMIGAGTSDHSYLFLPWILAAISLGLALYGHLRLNGTSVLSATIACYMLLSLPYYNVHTVLAGYADIWLAAAFGLAVFALREWHLNRSWSYGLLCLLLALLCSQIKVPGVVLAGILLLVLSRSIINAGYIPELIAAFCLSVFVAMLFLFGLDVNIPFLGRLIINADFISIPHLGRYPVEFHAVWSPFLESMLVMINWNITWYLLAVLVLTRVLQGGLFRQASADTLAIVGALAFVFFVFFFTEHHVSATNFVTLNRALLYLVPALIFYLFLHSGLLKSHKPLQAVTCSG